MAQGDKGDFTIYHEEYHSGQVELLAQNLGVFNRSSNGAIILDSVQLMGDYEKNTFFPMTSSLIGRRDPTDTTTAQTAKKIIQKEDVAVKLNKIIGPVDQTLDSWRKIGKTPELMSYIVGKQVGAAKLESGVNTVLMALVGALENVATLTYDYSATGTMTHGVLAAGIAKLGDASQRVTCLVMHSKVFHNLVAQAITDKIYGVANTVIYGGSPGTLGLPVVVTDSTSLVDSTGSTTYYKTLGLVAGAARLTESETEIIHSEIVTGFPNLMGRMQGEYAWNLGLKGFAWDTTNGGLNPTDVALATGSNWDQIATSIKDCAGVVVKTQ